MSFFPVFPLSISCCWMLWGDNAGLHYFIRAPGVCWANVSVVTVSASIVRLDQDFWQVFHGADAAHFEQHGGEAGWGSTQEVHLVRNFILRQVVGNCRHVQAGGSTQVSYSILKQILLCYACNFHLHRGRSSSLHSTYWIWRQCCTGEPDSAGRCSKNILFTDTPS